MMVKQAWSRSGETTRLFTSESREMNREKGEFFDAIRKSGNGSDVNLLSDCQQCSRRCSMIFEVLRIVKGYSR